MARVSKCPRAPRGHSGLENGEIWEHKTKCPRPSRNCVWGQSKFSYKKRKQRYGGNQKCPQPLKGQ